MKDSTQDYIDKEEDVQRKPSELYHIWRDGGEHWRYTSGDATITYNSIDYVPAPLTRTPVRYDSQLEVSTMNIQVAQITDPVVDFIGSNPVEILWVEVLRKLGDLDEVSVVFLGQIKGVSFRGVTANVRCVGFEHFLKMPIPTLRYQLTCNWELFDSKCKKVKADYKVTEVITLDSTKTELTAAAFGTYDDGYFIGGLVEFEDYYRTITNHEGTTITISYRMLDLESSDTVDVYPGCDGRVETCRDKYDNIINFLGFPFIPIDNPAVRTP